MLAMNSLSTSMFAMNSLSTFDTCHEFTVDFRHLSFAVEFSTLAMNSLSTSTLAKNSLLIFDARHGFAVDFRRLPLIRCRLSTLFMNSLSTFEACYKFVSTRSASFAVRCQNVVEIPGICCQLWRLTSKTQAREFVAVI